MEFFQKYGMLILLVLLIVAVIVITVVQSKRQKKRDQEIIDRNNSIKPGNKVKTIGGICGIVVEVDKEENTFVLETGSVDAGKSYIKFDMLAIYQTDAEIEGKKPQQEDGEEEDSQTPVDDADTEDK